MMRRLLRWLDAARNRRLDETFAGYARQPTGLPGEAEAAARGVPAYLRPQRNAPGERPIPVLIFDWPKQDGWQ